MKYSTSVLIFIILTVLACTYENPESFCVDQALERYEMEKYWGQKIRDCDSLLGKYKWNGEYYFQWGNNCVDADFNPSNCDGEPLSTLYPNLSWSQFLEEADYLGIVGIRQ